MQTVEANIMQSLWVCTWTIAALYGIVTMEHFVHYEYKNDTKVAAIQHRGLVNSFHSDCRTIMEWGILFLLYFASGAVRAVQDQSGPLGRKFVYDTTQ